MFQTFVSQSQLLTVARIVSASQELENLQYNPVGYVLSAAKDKEDQKMERRKEMIRRRAEKAVEEHKHRIAG